MLFLPDLKQNQKQCIIKQIYKTTNHSLLPRFRYHLKRLYSSSPQAHLFPFPFLLSSAVSIFYGEPDLRLVPQANFFAHFFGEGHQGTFSVSVKIIDGAHDVFSVRRKELFWQYKLETFIPNGLNERAADVELDLFACGIA